ncbi:MULTISPECIES: FIST N-terminal domain-containing protein [Spirulina sp. CCY15215]|uniref:FIST signal transduction protein n=1 Tax=Spirulina sp. CCY15215 TaxID=2767591 RepID=UPI00194F73B2|nr:FIST N-terminal domain-containing protein [Spirulina major]
MKIEQRRWSEEIGWESQPLEPSQWGETVQLVLIFGDRLLLAREELLNTIKIAYPNAYLLGCSTAGEIYNTQVSDEALVITAIQFERTQIKGTCVNLLDFNNSFAVGEKLAQSLDPDGLVHVFLLSEGIKINGSNLVRGIAQNLPQGVTVTGGLSGDGANFQETSVFWRDRPHSDAVVALGLYGKHLKVGYGSWGGWDPFGPERMVTRSEGNILYKLDGKSALELYKQYLGEFAKELPASGLLFPLSLRIESKDMPVVRTILGVDEAKQSMTFAGDIPEGSTVRLMKANFDRLVDGAIEAAEKSYGVNGSTPPDLAILISCVGRKLVLKQRIEEEVEGVREVMGDKTILTGFYSYGEISPFQEGVRCELHNQTMTITTLREE